MTVIELVMPEAKPEAVKEPSMQREEVFLKGGDKYAHGGFAIVVPEGLFVRVVVKAIVSEITAEEHAKATEGAK